MNPPPPPQASLVAKICVVLTLLLILAGAIVTTSGAGMAAPNAPHVEGALFNPNVPGTELPWYKDPALLREHGHRLVAISVGLAVGALAAMLWRNWTAYFVAIALMGVAGVAKKFGADPSLVAHLRIWPPMLVFLGLLLLRSKRRGEKPTPEQWMVFLAFIATCVQALFGALRVEMDTAGKIAAATNIRTIHGVFAQMFLALLVVLAARLSPVMRQIGAQPAGAKIARMAFSLLILYFIQLACAAYLRHRSLGLLIPTWPMAQQAGGLWPEAWACGDGALRHKLAIHILHTRLIPVLILGHVIGLAIAVAKRAAGERRLTRVGWGILGLVVLQIILGVLVIWRGRHPHITNTHVMVGAFICALAALLYARAQRARHA